MIEKRSSQRGLQSFRYDAEHRLIEVRNHGTAGDSVICMKYDPLGRRQEKCEWRNGFQTNKTTFLWDGLKLLEEQHNSQKSLYLYATSGYEPLARVDGRGHQQKIRYYHNDVNGSPLQLTEADGSPVWEATYKVWGNTLQEVQEPYYIEGQNLRYQGQYLDRETGLHYNTFRFYDPDVGRFTTRDPIGLAGGLNLYQYAPNPIGWIDPLGLSCSLSAKARKIHDVARDPFAKRNSTVAIAEVTINGKTTHYVAGSGGTLSPAQRKLAAEMGIPPENILSGTKVRSSNADPTQAKLENHAERVIIRNLPEGAKVEKWGVSWGGKQTNASCSNCQPHVDASGGIFD